MKNANAYLLAWALSSAINFAAGADNTVGFLIDGYCLKDNSPDSGPFEALDTKADLSTVPESHTLHCLRDPAVCRSSGYNIVTKEDGAAEYTLALTFDDVGNELTLAMLDTTKAGDPGPPGPPWKEVKEQVTASDFTQTTSYIELPQGNDMHVAAIGYLVDHYCWDDNSNQTLPSPPFRALDNPAILLNVNPELHTIFCMNVEVCKKSGYVILIKEAGASNFTAKYDLDVDSNEMAKTLLGTTTGVANALVQISGIVSEDKLKLSTLDWAPGAGRSGTMNTVGFLVDNWCWNDSGEGNNARFTELDTGMATLNITPWTHTLHCMRDPAKCRSSGYIIVTQQENAQNYSVALDFNDVGDALALLLLDATKQDDNSSNWRQSINEVTASDFTQSTSYIELPYTLDSIGDNSTTDNITYVGVMGYLVDHYCWDDNTNSNPPSKPFQALDVPTLFLNVNPELHSIFCLTVPPVCRQSGYYIAVKEFGSSTFSAKYDLDEASNEMAFALLNSTDAAITNNAIVQAGGKLVDGKLSLTAIDWAPSRIPPTTAVPPENGQALGSSGVLTTSFIDDYVTFTFEGTQEGWLGLGVTEEGCSGNCMLGGGQGADVVVCDDSGLKRYWVKLPQRQVEAGTTTSVDLPVIEGFDNTCEIGNGVTKMTFTRVVTGDIAANTRPVASGDTMIFASGDPTTIEFHGSDRGVFVLQGDAIVDKPNASIWAHMIFMVFSWGLLLPFGVIFARYNRTPPEWLKSRGLNWFHVHRGAQSIGWLLQLCGFISAVVYIGKTGGIHFGGPFNYHMIIGLLVVIFGTLQPLNAYFRPHAHETVDPDILCGCDDPRLRWQWIHKGSGYGAVFFGAINVVLGVHVAYQKFPGGGGLPTAAAVLAVLFLGPLVLYYLFKEATGGKVDPRPKGPHHKHMEMAEKEENPPK